jgi:hypothetical protein
MRSSQRKTKAGGYSLRTSFSAVLGLPFGRKFEPREMGSSQRKTTAGGYSLRTSFLCGSRPSVRQEIRTARDGKDTEEDSSASVFFVCFTPYVVRLIDRRISDAMVRIVRIWSHERYHVRWHVCTKIKRPTVNGYGKINQPLARQKNRERREGRRENRPPGLLHELTFSAFLSPCLWQPGSAPIYTSIPHLKNSRPNSPRFTCLSR